MGKGDCHIKILIFMIGWHISNVSAICILQFAVDTSLKTSYIVARMRHEIIFAPEAVDDLERLRANDRSAVRDAIEVHLRFEPQKTSKSRIKRLRDMRRPQYRLRVGEIRVFYDVKESDVEILAIVAKENAADWLAKDGEPE
jgi:mRNA-degrading endonuclease RelE of RelBE toxin-antitoxin system